MNPTYRNVKTFIRTLIEASPNVCMEVYDGFSEYLTKAGYENHPIRGAPGEPTMSVAGFGTVKFVCRGSEVTGYCKPTSWPDYREGKNLQVNLSNLNGFYHALEFFKQGRHKPDPYTSTLKTRHEPNQGNA